MKIHAKALRRKGNKKTKRTLFLVAIASLAGLGTIDFVLAQETPSRDQYVTHNTCKLCHNQTQHGTQWDIWAASPHARAYDTLFNEESLRIAKEMNLDVPPHESAQCLRCHVTAYDPQVDAPPTPLRVQDGIQCESCHGPGALHVVDGRRYWMEKDGSVDTLAHIERPTQRTCVRCHRQQSPTWNPERYTLPDGRTTGFDFQQAFEKIAHPLLAPFLEDSPSPATQEREREEVTRGTSRS